MDDHGFYVTLPCNASLSIYPENRISSYTTRLAKSLNLKREWQVGLAEIEYPRTWYTFNDDDGHFELNVYAPPSQKPGDEAGKRISGFSAIKNLQIKGGYYENVHSVNRAITEVIAPSGVMAYDQLKNKVQLVAKPYISLSFTGKLAAILGVKPGEALGQSNYHEKADLTKTVITDTPHQADMNGGVLYHVHLYQHHRIPIRG